MMMMVRSVMGEVLVPSQIDVTIIPGSLEIDGLELINLSFEMLDLS